MTREEFLLDMLEYYTVNSTRRCIDTAGCCSYSAISKYTEGCAIGRLLDKEDAQVLQENPFYGSSINELWDNYHEEIIKILPDWMMKLGREFLKSVQDLHDESDYWTSPGLSKYGKTFLLENILIKYELNIIKFNKFLN